MHSSSSSSGMLVLRWNQREHCFFCGRPKGHSALWKSLARTLVATVASSCPTAYWLCNWKKRVQNPRNQVSSTVVLGFSSSSPFCQTSSLLLPCLSPSNLSLIFNYFFLSLVSFPHLHLSLSSCTPSLWSHFLPFPFSPGVLLSLLTHLSPPISVLSTHFNPFLSSSSHNHMHLHTPLSFHPLSHFSTPSPTSPLRVSSGAQIKIAGNEGENQDRLVTITGTPEAVGMAQYLINSRYDHLGPDRQYNVPVPY